MASFKKLAALAATAAVAFALEEEASAEELQALAADEECAASGDLDCAVNVLQVHGGASSHWRCMGRPDGTWCHDDKIINCSANAISSQAPCAFYEDCKMNVGGVAGASCVDDACDDKIDGLYCKDDHVVKCVGQKVAETSRCAFYQECKKNGGGVGVASCMEDACDDKPDGQFCKHDNIVECAGQKTVNSTICPAFQECKKNVHGFGIPGCVVDDD